MSYLQFRISHYVFRPTWVGALITVVCIPLFIYLGQWQYEKAATKQQLQQRLDSFMHEAPVDLPEKITAAEEWKYRRVRVEGVYEPRYQIILDNQVENGRAGYHVITPLKIGGSDKYVLVDRGWIPAEANHRDMPVVITPVGSHVVTGNVWVPSSKFYSLEKPQQQTDSAWQPLWQNMDMKRYAATAPITVLPIVIRLDADSEAGGFSRNWPAPAERLETHIGYAYQWFGFAVAAFIIFIVVSFRKKESKESDSNAN